MTIDFTDDLDGIMDKTRVTLKRDTITYNDRGDPIHSWGTIVTADVDIQPLTPGQQARMTEAGRTEVYTHIVFCYYNTSGVKITAYQGDRLYDASNKIYEIKQVNEYISHIQIYAVYVEGKA